MTQRRCLILASVLILPAACISAAGEEPSYFAIRINDKLLGYAIVERETVTQDGRDMVRLKSETSLKVALLGEARHTLLKSETLLEADSRRPIRYQLTATTNSVSQHVKSEFTEDGLVRTWTHRAGDEPGQPVETKLNDDVEILGNNNFAHWQLLLESASDHSSAGDAATMSVFLPDAGQVQRFQLFRGEPQVLAVAGTSRRCVLWRLEQANLNIFADARTHEVLRMELPAQQTTIELASESVVQLAQESGAAEVLDRHFVQSNVAFDDFLKVDLLTAKIDVAVIGSGVGNDSSVLTTTMQCFDGQQEADHITGTLTVRSVRYNGENSPAVSVDVDNPELAKWLKPSAYIESDHSSIVNKSTELAQGAKTRWDAVQRIGQWIHQKIAYSIADTPSARLALDKRTGDCGPHSTLMVAMLRAVGIPSRLVGGLVYTPTFGGSFGQHAWVEVHMGDAGWVSIDPTTGEFRLVNATHLKLFEGLGGVLPKSVIVQEFQPPNRAATAAKRAQIKPLAWTMGREYTFHFTRGDQELGTETITIAKIDRDGQECYELKSEVQLSINPAASLKSGTTLVVNSRAMPLSFERDLSTPGQLLKIECSFGNDVAKEKVSGSKNLSREVTLPAGTYCFDNNLMGCWVLICSQLFLEPDKPVKINTYHPSSLQIIPLTFTPQALAALKIGEQEIQCFECEVEPIKNTFWISEDGQFVRAQQGELVIEVTAVD